MEIKVDDGVYRYADGKQGVVSARLIGRLQCSVEIDWDDGTQSLGVIDYAGLRQAFLDRGQLATANAKAESLQKQIRRSSVAVVTATRLLERCYQTRIIPFAEIARFLGMSIDRASDTNMADATGYALGTTLPLGIAKTWPTPVKADPPSPPEQTAILSLQEEFDGWKKDHDQNDTGYQNSTNQKIISLEQLASNLSRAGAKEQQEINERFEKLEAKAFVNDTLLGVQQRLIELLDGNTKTDDTRYAKLEGRVSSLEYRTGVKNAPTKSKPEKDA